MTFRRAWDASSGEKVHAAFRGCSIEHHGLSASGCSRTALDQAGSKIGLSSLEGTQRLPHRLGLFHEELSGSQQPTHEMSDLVPRCSVAAFGYPDEFYLERARSQGYGWLLFRAQGALGSGIGREAPDPFLSTGRIAAVPVLTGPKQQVAVVAFFSWVDDSVAATAGFNFAVSIAAIPQDQVAVVALLARLHETIAAVAGLMLGYPTAQVVATHPVELYAAVVIAAIPRSSVPVVAALTRIDKPISAGQRPGRWRQCASGTICSPSRIGDGNAISTTRT
jgi:hypothetical protein